MSKLDDAIANVAYILDALMAYRNIVESGDCNNCKAQRKCEVKPKLGQLVRLSSVRLDDGTFFKIIGGDNDA